MAQGNASTRELATAAGIMLGKSVSQAMREAGYSAAYARTNAGKVEAKLRALGLLPEPSELRDVLAMFRQVVVEEDRGEALVTAWRAHLSRAQAGDVQAMRFVMEYLAGKPSQPVAHSGEIDLAAKVYLGVDPEAEV